MVSIGYTTSHQCRIADTFFEDPETAALINSAFVSVKVDRRSTPRSTPTSPSWCGRWAPARLPLNRLLDPRGAPLSGPVPRCWATRPRTYRSSVEDAARLWGENPDEARRKASATVEQLRRSASGAVKSEPLGPALLQQAVFGIQAAFDDVNGGFGEPPSRSTPLPSSSCFGRAPGRRPGRNSRRLDPGRMARGGIYDQIGGGFHHLAVDRAWRVPRFEKLLVDNALLVRAYVHAWQLGKDELFSRIALETVEYLLRDLSDPAGAFYAGESATGDGQEGGFYTWGVDEVTMVAPDAVETYGVIPSGHFKGRNVLSLTGDEMPGAAQAALLKRRGVRTRPERDEKILTSWNGLAIAALAEAGAALERADLVEAARRAASAMLHRNRHKSSGRLRHISNRNCGPGCWRTTPTWRRVSTRCGRPPSSRSGSLRARSWSA